MVLFYPLKTNKSLKPIFGDLYLNFMLKLQIIYGVIPNHSSPSSVTLYLESYTIMLRFLRFWRVFGFRGLYSTPQSKTLPSHLLLCWYLAFLHTNLMVLIRIFTCFAVELLIQVWILFDWVVIFNVFLFSFHDFNMIHIWTQNWLLFISKISWFADCLDCLLKFGGKGRRLGNIRTFELFWLSLHQTEFMHGFIVTI